MLFSEEEELQQEREKLRGRWRRTAPIVIFIGSLIVVAGASLIACVERAEEFGTVFILLGACIVYVGLQYYHNLYTHREISAAGMRSTEV